MSEAVYVQLGRTVTLFVKLVSWIRMNFNRRRNLIFIYPLVIFHATKDFLQDLLESPFLKFLDVQEDLFRLPQFLRWVVAVLNILTVPTGLFLVIAVPIVLRRKETTLLEKVVWAALAAIFAVIVLDYFLDPRTLHPSTWFDESKLKPAGQVKKEYIEILKGGPF